MTANGAALASGIAATAAIVPAHYASEEHVARALARLGKPRSAALIESKLPTTKQIRSGDLGEIYATEWIDAHSGFRAPIKRLRWKDHRNMAMRGDDVIAIQLDVKTQRLRFLKTEAKSRAKLTAKVLAEARAGLDKDGGLPSAHALAFISERLVDMQKDLPLADAIDDALLKHTIPAQSVTHLLFVFTGNAPENLLTTALQNYTGKIGQWGLGLHVDGHAKFIGAIYDKVIVDAHKP